MHALGICSLEMRHLVESQFLPLRCECRDEEGGSLLICIHDPDTGQVVLNISGVSQDRFASSREILYLVRELRAELDHVAMPHAKAS